MMLTDTEPAGVREYRDRAHDLRNLFGAIASARHMLDDHLDDARRTLLLDAIEEAAMRGGALTTRMLAASPDATRERFDPARRLQLLQPLLSSIAGAGRRLAVDARGPRVLARGAPDRFDHVAIELVANAADALGSEGDIRIRLRARHGRISLLVADTGCGMHPARCRALLVAAPAAGAHGTGLQQIRRFAHDTHGKVQIRSTAGKGTAVLLTFPALAGHE